jgi:hypothetical protein
LVQRVLYVEPQQSRDAWLKCGRDGLRVELIPSWAKSLWGDSTDRDAVPRRKFGWREAELSRHPGQPDNHHAECFAMSVLEGRVRPSRWAIVDNGRLAQTPCPDWLSAPWFETLYECFTLLGVYPKPSPNPRGVYGYGDSLLRRALDSMALANANVPVLMRALRDRYRDEGFAVKDPDLLALPRAGGPLVAIEAKSAGKDSLHADGGQENALLLLQSLGACAEVWWVCDEVSRFTCRNAAERTLPRLQQDPFRLQVRSNVDWPTARASALAAVKKTWRPPES